MTGLSNYRLATILPDMTLTEALETMGLTFRPL
jgi:hypothetical protein